MVHFYSSDDSYQHTSSIKGVFFDLDDVLYEAPADLQDYHDDAGVKAVHEHLPYLDKQEIMDLMRQSQEEGGSFDIFIREHGVDGEELRKTHYKHLIANTEGSDFLEPEDGLYGGIGKLRISGINVHIITHGNPEWTEHVTSQGDKPLYHFFTENSTCKDEMPDLSGKTGHDIYHKGLDKMAVPHTREDGALRGEGHAMVEDTMRNLKAAKELGMMTILVNRGHLNPDEIEDYVDVVVDRVEDAVNVIMKSNAVHEIDQGFYHGSSEPSGNSNLNMD